MRTLIKIFSIYSVLCYCTVLNAQMKNDTLYLRDTAYDFIEKHSIGRRYYSEGAQHDTFIYIDRIPISIDSIGSRRYLLKYIFFRDNELPIAILDSAGTVRRILTANGEGYLGNYREYNSDGKLVVQGQYCIDHPGIKRGLWFYFDSSGVLTKKKKYRHKKKCNYQDGTL